MTAASAALAPLVEATTSKSSSGSSTILVFVVIGAAFYFLIYRPQQKKQRAARTQSNAYEVGDEVVTAGGIVGRVLDIEDDRVTLETSVGASFVVLRPYILRKLEPVVAPTDVVDGSADEDHEPGGEDGAEVEGPVPPSEPPADADDAAADDASLPVDVGNDPKAPTSPPPAEDDDDDPSGPDAPPRV
jgi:preprotein translocase subunit YajC